MKLGVFTVLFRGMAFEQMLDKVRGLGLDCVELGTGNYPGNEHCDPATLLADPAALRTFQSQMQQSGLFISGLACQSNPLHPNRAMAREAHETFERTVLLAEKLEVPVINLISGCPGESHEAKYPNWPGFAWPPDFPELWEWQWREVAVPYWKKAAEFARAHGIKKLAIEMHPGFTVFNVETALRLREKVGETIGVNLDPSHLWWNGVELPAAIEALKGSIFHCHAKDVHLNQRNTAVNGCMDCKPYSEVAQRSWSFRTVGWGHDLAAWRELVSALRLAGYDYVLSIEHEDPLASPEEGLRNAVSFLRQATLAEPPGEIFWA
jgi:sugar phosphate isomerase/epimerase